MKQENVKKLIIATSVAAGAGVAAGASAGSSALLPQPATIVTAIAHTSKTETSFLFISVPPWDFL